MNAPRSIIPDRYYIVEGKVLIAIRVLTEALILRVEQDDAGLSRVELAARLGEIKGALPVDPMLAI